MLDAEIIKDRADLLRIAGSYLRLQKSGTAMVALCPFHTESTPSFTVHEKYFKCFGCGKGGDVFEFIQGVEGIGFSDAVKRVAEIVGVQPIKVNGTVNATIQPQQSRTTAVYGYVDEQGATLYEICRVEPGKGGKSRDFLQRFEHAGATVWQKHPRQVLYHLPDVLAAEQVFICEGEKDADTAMSLGFVGTTAAGGCNAKWLPGYTESLRGKSVIVLPDQDAPGLKRGEEIRAAVESVAAEVIVVNVPSGKDLTEWIENGGTVEILTGLIELARSEQTQARLTSKGLLSPEEIIEISGGFTIFCDPSKRPRGLSTGIRRLDELTLGMQPGQLVILAARPSMGKTSLALNIAQHVLKQGAGVAFFSLEMGREELLTRAVCSAATVDLMKFRLGYLSQQERMKFAAALQDLHGRPIFIDETTDLNIARIEERIAPLRDTVDLVVLDYLQLMEGSRRENRTQEVSALSRGLKLLAKKLKKPFLVLSQLNRSAETRPGEHIPQLSDLRESGSIEQDADMVWFIYRAEYYKPDREDLRGIAEIIIAKQRNGPIGKVRVSFLKELTRFENLVEDVAHA